MHVQIGQIYRLHFNKLSNAGISGRMKWAVVALVNPLVLFVINSDRTELQKARPDLAAINPPLLVSEHPFLQQDRFLGCGFACEEFTVEMLTEKVRADPTKFYGHLHPRMFPVIHALMADNPDIKSKFIEPIRAAWATAPAPRDP